MIVQIISGFRGSGKTTFLNQCTERVTGKTAIIQNDFGAQAVERKSQGEELIYEEISEGCICCGMALEFEEKMRLIVTKECPERIFIEASGFGKLSDVEKVCQRLKEREKLNLTIGPNVTVVDIPAVEAYVAGLGDFYTDQITCADVILVNHIDMEDSDAEEIEAGWQTLEKLNPKALKTEDSEAAADYLLAEKCKSQNHSDSEMEARTGKHTDADFQIEENILVKYLGADEIVKIPENVQIIGDSAFEYCMEVKEIQIPASVHTIGKHAFQGSGIQKVCLPEGLKIIDIYAFSGTPLEYAYLPESLNELGHSAFRYCRMLKKVRFPEHFVEIPHDTFNDCGKLREVKLSGDLEVIGAHAFSGCAALRQMQLPESVKCIEEGAFVTCVSLEKVHLPKALEKVGRKVFYRCSNLKEVHLPARVTEFGKGIFSQCAALRRVYIEGCPVDEEVFQDWDMWTTCYDMDEIIAPNMEITRFAKEWRMWAAAGLADYLAEQGDVREEILDSYVNDLKEHRTEYEKILLGNKKLLQFFIRFDLLTKEAVNRLLDQSLEKMDMEVRSMLLNYQDTIRDQGKKEEMGSQLDQLLAALS